MSRFQRLHHLIPPTILLSITALMSRVLGVYRDHLLAHTFGATAGQGIFDLDVYYAAFRIPDLLYNLLIFGTISAAFIPIFTEYKKKDDWKNAWEFSSAMLNWMLLIVSGISVVAFIFAPYLIHLVAGGFTPDQLHLASKLLRIMLISPILFGASSVLVSIQDSLKLFFFRSLGPIFYNLGIIGGILWGAERFGIFGVTMGVIAGVILQFLIQLPSLWRTGFRYSFILGRDRADLRKAMWLTAPRMIGLGINQFTLWANTLIASFLATGSITVLYLADNLQSLPLGIIGISFAITSFATLSELAHTDDHAPFATELRRVIDRILFLIIPATVGMILLRHEIIDLILTTGRFSARDAELTAQVLFFLLFSLFAQSLLPLLGRAFYAHHDTRTPLWSGIFGSIVNVILGLVLAFYFHMGIVGVAIAYSIDNLLDFGLLVIFMQRKIRHALFDGRSIFSFVISSAVMAAVVVLMRFYVPYTDVGFIQKALTLGLYSAVGAGVYFGVIYLFRPDPHQLS